MNYSGVGFGLLVFLLVGCSLPTRSDKLILGSCVGPEHPCLSKQIRFLEEVLETLDYYLEVQQYQSAICFDLSNSGQVDGEIWRIRGVDSEYQNLIRVPVPLWLHPEFPVFSLLCKSISENLWVKNLTLGSWRPGLSFSRCRVGLL